MSVFVCTVNYIELLTCVTLKVLITQGLVEVLAGDFSLSETSHVLNGVGWWGDHIFLPI